MATTEGARRWLDRPFNVRHWALRVLSRGAPTILNMTFENGSLDLNGDHSYVHGLTIHQPPAIRMRGGHVTVSGVNVIGGAAIEGD